LQAHKRALQAFAEVLSGVQDGQLEAPTPCSEWTVRQLVGHVVAGNNRVAGEGPTPDAYGDGGAGQGREWGPGDVKAVRAAYEASAERAHAAFAAPDGLTRSFAMPFGEVPGAVFVRMRATDVLVHAWDLAKATGRSTDLDPELAEEQLAISRQSVRPEVRGQGRPFGAEQPCPEGRPAADRLAAFLGRSVS